jgi:hypothetical protein
MKPETVIKIGEIEIRETGENSIAIIPARAVYDVDFSNRVKHYDYACIVHKCTDFLVKDREGMFHKFSGMTYCGTVKPSPSVEEMVKCLIEKFQGALVVSIADSTVVINGDRVVAAGCKRLYDFILGIIKSPPIIMHSGFYTFHIQLYHGAPGGYFATSEAEKDWITCLYKEHFPS